MRFVGFRQSLNMIAPSRGIVLIREAAGEVGAVEEAVEAWALPQLFRAFPHGPDPRGRAVVA